MSRKYIKKSEVSAKAYDSRLWKQFVSVWHILDKISKWEVDKNQSMVILLG